MKLELYLSNFSKKDKWHNDLYISYEYITFVKLQYFSTKRLLNHIITAHSSLLYQEQ